MKSSWLSRIRGRRGGTGGQPVPQLPADVTRASPGLEAVLAALPRRQQCRILDLGPATADNVTALGEVARWVRILDLTRIEVGRRSSLPETIENGIRSLCALATDQDAVHDLVLAWDLVNYVPRNRVSPLMEALGDLCTAGGRVLLSVTENHPIPARPNRHRIIGPSRVRVETITSEIGVAPELPPAAVERALKGFQIERTFVLRHGVREYVALKATSEY
jgi:hypothetical protein